MQLREERVWNTSSWAIALLLEEHQQACIALHSWPYAPRHILVGTPRLTQAAGTGSHRKVWLPSFRNEFTGTLADPPPYTQVAALRLNRPEVAHLQRSSSSSSAGLQQR